MSRSAVLTCSAMLGAVAVILMCPLHARAQIDRSEVNGTVADSSGAVVPRAAVELQELATGITRQVTANDSGTFVLSSLPIGRFVMTVTKPGFSTLRISDIDLNAGVTRTIDARLQVESANQTVTVEASSASDLDKNDATFGGTVQSEQVARMPLNGRNIATLELLAPGVIDTGTGQQATIHIAGQGIDDNNYRFDGVDATGGIRQALKSGLRLQFSTEAVAEFKVDSGAYTADTGGSAGGQVSLISKSGTNAFHGAVFDYLRNNYFDALPLIQSTSHPNFHLNQFGANAGGPIVRERTFFFANYEGFRQTLGGIPAIGTVPSAAYRARLLAAQPSLAPFINAYPASGVVSAKDPNQALFTSIVPSPNNENSGVVRIDHRLRSNDSMYGRYSIDDGITTSALNNAAEAITVGSRVQNLVLEELHTFSGGTRLNEAEFGFNRNTYLQDQNTGLPYNFAIAGFTTLAETYSKAQVPTSYSVNDTFTLTRGQHTIKTGVDIRRVQLNESNSTDGTLSFTAQPGVTAEQAVLNNQLNSIQVTAPLNTRGLRKTQYAAYVQDQWKATPEVTVNYGLRYNNFGPFNEAHNNANPFDFASCGGYCGTGAQFYFRNFLSFDPRVGVAYSPSGLHGRTVLRAGFGIYHGETQLGDQDSPVVNTDPSTTLTSSAGKYFSYPAALQQIPTTGLATTPRSMARHHPDSYTTQYTASVQQALGGQTTLTATYLGIKGTHLFRRTYTNLIDPATGVRPFGGMYPSQIDTKQTQGMSIFHALQVNVTRRFHNGLLVTGNYMYAHALDDDSVGAGESASAENVNCFRCDYANSSFDVRHSTNASLVYDLPFGRGRRYLSQLNGFTDQLIGGWALDSLLTARSGLPVDITLSRSSSALPDGNNVNQRPDRVPGVPLYNGKGIRTWLNPAAFQVPLPGTFGNLGRDAAVGPNLWQDDSAVEKHFQLTERNQAIFRAEAFNLFNRAQYGQPNASLSTGTVPAGSPAGTRPSLSVPATFGQITSPINTSGLVGTGTQRVLEFALRLTF